MLLWRAGKVRAVGQMETDRGQRLARVLVVDDDRPMRWFCAEALRRAGYAVDVALNGSDALGMLRQRSYDLVLSDVEMPELGGIELYNELERLNSPMKDRFLLMSGKAISKEEFQNRRVNCIMKPFAAADLVRSVGSMVFGVERRDAERRCEPRYKLVEECSMSGHASGARREACTVDVSRNGMRVLYGGEPIEAGARVTVAVGPMGLDSTATVVWSSPARRGEYVSGLRLSGVNRGMCG